MTVGQLKKIKIDLISKMKFPPVDIYLLIDNKMIKIIAKESENYSQELKHYQSKNVSYVHVTPVDFDQMIKVVTLVLEQKNKKVTNLALEIAADTFNFLRTKLLYLEVSPLEIDDMNNSLNQFVSSLSGASKSFQDRLKVFLARKDYVLVHSIMVSYVATLISKRLDWHNEQIMQKIHFASLFKDIYIENPYIAKIRSLESEEYKGLEKDLKNLVTNHSEMAIKYLKQIDYLPQEVESMITFHHELPDGTGFNRNMGADKLSPLACTFNIACYFCQEFLEGHNDFSGKEIVERMEPLFNRGNYKSPYKALLKVVQGD